MRAYYLVSKEAFNFDQTLIADERDNLLYQLSVDDVKHVWSLKSYEKDQILHVFELGYRQNSIRFNYRNHIYTVKKSVWGSHYVVQSSMHSNHEFKYLSVTYKGYFFIDGIEQSYFDEDSNVIATKEEESVFLLLVHLAVYIMMHSKSNYA